jgi:predicted SprT family Zn-dependent metalloprotease
MTRTGKMNLLTKLERECRKEMENLNIPVAEFKLEVNNRSKSRLGVCRRRAGKFIIEISDFVFDISEKEVRNTLVHEMLHTVDKCFNHGNTWKYNAMLLNRKYGYDISRTCSREVSKEMRKVVPYKYMIECQECGMTTGRHKFSNLISQTYRFRCKCGGELRRTK